MGNQVSDTSSTTEQKIENLNLTDQNLTQYHFSKIGKNCLKGLFLSGNRFTSLPKNLRHVSIVDLSNNQIESVLPIHIAESLTSYSSLTKLDLSHNQLNDLSDYFKNSKIESFLLAQNRFTSFPPDFVILFPNLTEVAFDYNFFPNLSDFHSEILQQLTLSCNSIETLNIESINLPNLHTLDLSRNKIKSIPTNFSQSFPSLLLLDLSDNFLDELPEIELKPIARQTKENEVNNASADQQDELNNIATNQRNENENTSNDQQNEVSNASNDQQNEVSNGSNEAENGANDTSVDMQKQNSSSAQIENDNIQYVFPKTLQKLKLINNLLTKIPNSITCLPQLEELFLTGNKIEEIPILPSSLTRLEIAGNNIAHFDDQKLPLMKKCHISRNSFTEIPFGIEIGDCDSLIIDHNLIKRFTFDRIKLNQLFIKSIVCIDISFNQIDYIPGEIFNDLTELQTFNANFNNISEIPVEIVNCKTLTKLCISHNPIKKLPKLPPNLEQLFASDCEIDSVDDVFFNVDSTESDFDVNSKMKTVVLSSNNLVSFPSMPNICQLYLSCNKLEEFPRITKNMSVLDVSMNKITDNSMPEALIGPSLLCLDISYNQITHIPPIRKPNMLTRLKFAGNPIQESRINVSEASFLDSLDISQTGITDVVYNNMRECIASCDDIHINKLTAEQSKLLPFGTPGTDQRLNYVFKNRKHGNLIVRGCYSEIQGWRASMEDSIIVRDDLGLYAVCDGHGGPWTAMFISHMFASLFEKYFPSTLQMCIMKTYKKKCKHHECPSNRIEIFTQDEVRNTTLSIYHQVEQKLLEKQYEDGSTLCLCFLYHVRNDGVEVQDQIDNDENIETNIKNLTKRKVLTAHLGDARALIMRTDGSSRTLTVDHKPFMRTEFERVHNEYGFLIGNRIDGVLAVSRSMGDRCVSSVGHEIEINEFDIDDNDQYLILGCDGVFDVLSNDEVANIAYKSSSPNDAAHRIINAAFGAGSSDNISVIVVDLVNKKHEKHHNDPNQS